MSRRGSPCSRPGRAAIVFGIVTLGSLGIVVAFVGVFGIVALASIGVAATPSTPTPLLSRPALMRTATSSALVRCRQIQT